MKATFAAGCFWCVEPSFSKIKGVTSTMVGFTGGRLENPTYEDVCSGQTGHAEAIQVEYDPSAVSYDELLEVFWGNHDPKNNTNTNKPNNPFHRLLFWFKKESKEY